MKQSLVELSDLIHQMVNARGVVRQELLAEVRIAEFMAGHLHYATWFVSSAGRPWRFAGGRLPGRLLASLTAVTTPDRRPCGVNLDPITDWQATASGWIGHSPALPWPVVWNHQDLPVIEWQDDVFGWLFDTLGEEKFRQVWFGQHEGAPAWMSRTVPNIDMISALVGSWQGGGGDGAKA